MLFLFFSVLILSLLAEAKPVLTEKAASPLALSPSSLTTGEVESTNHRQKATIVVGFPGIGKSWVMQHKDDVEALKTLEICDEPGFVPGVKTKDKFNGVYKEILRLKSQEVLLLAPAHPEVRDFLIKNEIRFFSVYPKKGSTTKKIYLDKYRDRTKVRDEGIAFANTAKIWWDKWQEGSRFKSSFTTQVELGDKQTLRDVLPKILKASSKILRQDK